MELFCACPFAVATLGWERAPGARSLSVCVKATFVLAPGAPLAVAPVQDPVRADEGIAAPAPDLVPYKPRADVLFTGHAHAPGRAPTDSLIARARIHGFRKSLSINGDRAWVPSFEGLRPSVAVPFRHMPLAYERAVRTGENLAGVDISQGAELNRPLANIAAIAEQGGETPGLGPIPFGWRALRHGLAEPALLWASRAGLGLGPPPPGLDFHIFNAAPAEQQLDDLPPGAELHLENLHPEHPMLTARLSFLRAKVFRRPPRSDQSTEIPTRCDTLWIDTDRGLAIALFRAVVLLDPGTDDDAIGRLVVTAEADGERIGPPEVDRMLARFAPDLTYVDARLLRDDAPAHPSFPDIPDPIPVPPLPALSPSATPPSSIPESGAAPTNIPPPLAPQAPPSVAPEPARAPITLVPPTAAEVSAIEALPFRPPPTGFEGLDLFPAQAPSEPPDDDEQTPPRGYAVGASPSGPGLSSGAATPDASDVYRAVKMEAWQGGQPLGEVLARHGIDEASFHAHEAAQLEALGREGAAGGSALAIALLEGMDAAGQGETREG